MSRIEVYVNNLFAAIPDSREAREMKQNIIDSMEDNYQALRDAGKNENEAFGEVISQFGTVDEIREALGVQSNAGQEGGTPVPPEMLEDYLVFRKKFALLLPAGIVLCVLGLVVMLFLEPLLGDLSSAFLFLFAALGAGLIVYICLEEDSWNKIEKSWKQGQETVRYQPEEILKEEPETEFPQYDKKRRKRLASRISSVIMLAATLWFFVQGFWFGHWGTAWVVFPVAGVGCALMEELLKLVMGR